MWLAFVKAVMNFRVPKLAGNFLTGRALVIFGNMTVLLAINTVSYLKSYDMVKIIGRDRQNLNEFQTDVNRYILAEVIWRSNNEARRTWTLLAMIICTRCQHIPGD